MGGGAIGGNLVSFGGLPEVGLVLVGLVLGLLEKETPPRVSESSIDISLPAPTPVISPILPTMASPPW
jgi:hypothetical protein